MNEYKRLHRQAEHGISLKSYRMLTSVAGYSFPAADAYTPAQYAVALFPEYN